MADCPFKIGDKVEVTIDEKGFRGAWFAATVVKTPVSRRGKKLTIDYDDLVSAKDENTPLREPVEIVNTRPAPPREANRTFAVSDEVDVFHNDAWWEGTVMKVVPEASRYEVYFRSSKEQTEFDASDLRLHREWTRGQDWLPPLPEPQKAIASTSGLKQEVVIQEDLLSKGSLVEKAIASSSGLNQENAIQEDPFSKGSLVEVSSNEEGYKGAWFAATVVQVLENGNYLIEYKELMTDDGSDFVKEEVDALHIRPTPPKIDKVGQFKQHEEVDALENDGWWVGVIVKVYPDTTCGIFFKESNEELIFRQECLRPHQDWMDGKWVTTSKALKSGD